MPHRFDPQHWERLVSADRRKLLDPERVLDLLGVAPGMTVVDLGAGPGFFTLPLAARVGPAGAVHAVDVAPEMVAVLKSRRPPAQVQTHLVEDERLPLEDGSADLVLLAFVFHELHDRARTLAEIRRVLRARGRVALLEWIPQTEEIGPPPHERVAQEECERALSAVGFAVDQRATLNGSHYMIVGARDRATADTG